MGFNDDVLEGNLVDLGSASVNSTTQNANNFLAIYSSSRTATEALAQRTLDVPIRMVRAYVLVNANTKDAASVFAVRRNGADLVGTISYAAAETGRKSLDINTDILATDLLNFRFDTVLSTINSITAQIWFIGFAQRRPS